MCASSTVIRSKVSQSCIPWFSAPCKGHQLRRTVQSSLPQQCPTESRFLLLWKARKILSAFAIAAHVLRNYTILGAPEKLCATSCDRSLNPGEHTEVHFIWARWPMWLEREFTDRKVLRTNPTPASRLPLSRLGQPGSIPALVLPSGDMAP
ncbi:hypothetical protein T265_05475 [Opisthorchis viverrini]|uniref:Uncharacterized protein n=1 Tax=Opisthorchis viverrini TaxID=6198 RepID=A0A074ZKE4_OPIVI|nr:hypothetical protein T265_05475 [Opisthorchis viverrini]KER27516.1 hypothetical protein T265_05475 [Opisthorchis viverrini]